MNELKIIIDRMKPDDALTALTEEVRSLLSHMDEEKRADFVVTMIGDTDGGRVAGLVDL